ncbi:MAG: hypothetical protein SNJ59_04835 [Aggregatilineales bacterium]
MEIDVDSGFGAWIRLLIVLLMLVLGVQQTVSPEPIPQAPTFSPAPAEDLILSPTIIEDVTIEISAERPAQLELRIHGYQPDGCELPVVVEQRREGNIVFVSIYRILRSDMICPMALQPYSETIALDGVFASGAYTIRINDFTIEVTV